MKQNKAMLIESDPHQTRIAVLENDRLTELFIERPEQRGLVGNIYKGRVNRVLPGMQAAFVDIGLERDAFLYVDDAVDPLSSYDDLMGAETPSIGQLLKPGQELIVQVLKDALPNKGARISTQITLPGRYLVLLPGSTHLGISRRIEDEEERERLSRLVEDIRLDGAGLIVRTASIGHGRDALAHDLRLLESRWQRIRRHGHSVSAPTLIHRELDLAERVVRDYLTEEFSVLRVAGEKTFQRIRAYLEALAPALVDRVKLDDYDSALFERFGIAAAVEEALKPQVSLRSGGSIVINPTEALVAIDVNTGRYVGRNNLEETVLTTNLEAVREVVRQIRLRNLGGIIVIDLIDMENPEHRQQVFDALCEELKKDRAKTKLLEISDFGLVQLTRKRSRPSLDRQLTRRCPYCDGTGRIRSQSTVCLELRRQVLIDRRRLRGREVLLRVHPEIASTLQHAERAILDELEAALDGEILLQSDSALHQESFEILEA
ncbi:MAG: Rne/Rng family ribonuclease [Acidobacteria bacterium]|nr:MAG: Rne/Rng family ribonuclease [Acidobacteriota bacterium]